MQIDETFERFVDHSCCLRHEVSMKPNASFQKSCLCHIPQDHKVGDGPFVIEGFEAADALPDLADSWRTTGTEKI